MMPEPAHSRDEAANHQLPISGSLLNHPNSFHRGMFKLNAKFDTDSLLCSLSHFDCNGHTVHMLTQLRLLPPLTSTVKSSLFMHVYSSPLSLASRLHLCGAKRSHYINNGWTFSGQTSYDRKHLITYSNKYRINLKLIKVAYVFVSLIFTEIWLNQWSNFK